jgi:hypothetical protein
LNFGGLFVTADGTERHRSVTSSRCTSSTGRRGLEPHEMVAHFGLSEHGVFARTRHQISLENPDPLN